MKTTREWAATSNEFQIQTNDLPFPPEPPEGDGWRLVAAIPASYPRTSGVVWYWERDVPASCQFKKGDRARFKGTTAEGVVVNAFFEDDEELVTIRLEKYLDELCYSATQLEKIP